MDAGARATQEQLPVGPSILGQPPRSEVMIASTGEVSGYCISSGDV
ncbi:hypothetical protein [Endozoicomonas atrinae]|nr:hypothetical protein [Endozoicomonas atrinae]